MKNFGQLIFQTPINGSIIKTKIPFIKGIKQKL